VVLGLLPPTRAVLRVAEPAATPLLQHLQLLFVPPGVGIVLELHSLAQNALPIALAVGGSFVVTLLVAGRLLQALLRRQVRRRGGSGAAGGSAGPVGPAASDGSSSRDGRGPGTGGVPNPGRAGA